jgi:hypothetical protein
MAVTTIALTDRKGPLQALQRAKIARARCKYLQAAMRVSPEAYLRALLSFRHRRGGGAATGFDKGVWVS